MPGTEPSAVRANRSGNRAHTIRLPRCRLNRSTSSRTVGGFGSVRAKVFPTVVSRTESSSMAAMTKSRGTSEMTTASASPTAGTSATRG